MRIVKAAGVQLSPILYNRDGNGRNGRAEDPRAWPTGGAVRHVSGDRRALLPVLLVENGTWGGEIRSEFAPQPGDIVALEHWCSSGFAHTDLDLQLKKHGIHQLIVIGLLAHTCAESTVRFAAELGCEVTMLKDATADYSDEETRRSRPQYPELRQCHRDNN